MRHAVRCGTGSGEVTASAICAVSRVEDIVRETDHSR